MEDAQLFDQQVARLAHKDLQVAPNLCQHSHSAVHEQIVEGEDELAGAFEHLGTLAYEEVLRCRVFILQLPLS